MSYYALAPDGGGFRKSRNGTLLKRCLKGRSTDRRIGVEQWVTVKSSLVKSSSMDLIPIVESGFQGYMTSVYAELPTAGGSL